MQRVLFLQLTKNPMPLKDNATPESQLIDLQTACAGKCWLVVLDDVWDPQHEKMLNCVDPASSSKLLVTTRIRGLLKTCDEVSLNLLAPTESVDLLLRTGQVADVDESAKTAAGEIAELCGHLPLCLSICGGVILGYEKDLAWQTELVGMLKEDRVGVLGEGSGDDAVECLVDSSLKMLQDESVKHIFLALGMCPEDVLVHLPVAQLVCGCALSTKASSTVAMRRSLKSLLDRNLLQGSIGKGVQLHDIVRDLVRKRLVGDDLGRPDDSEPGESGLRESGVTKVLKTPFQHSAC